MSNLVIEEFKYKNSKSSGKNSWQSEFEHKLICLILQEDYPRALSIMLKPGTPISLLSDRLRL